MYKGAGVLIYHIDEKTKELSVYLGKRVNNPDRGMWSLFGGERDKKDKSLKHTALRELFEETLFKPNLRQLHYLTKIDIPLIFEFDVYALKSKNKIETKMRCEISDAQWFNVNELPSNLARFLQVEINLLKNHLGVR